MKVEIYLNSKILKTSYFRNGTYGIILVGDGIVEPPKMNGGFNTKIMPPATITPKNSLYNRNLVPKNRAEKNMVHNGEVYIKVEASPRGIICIALYVRIITVPIKRPCESNDLFNFIAIIDSSRKRSCVACCRLVVIIIALTLSII